MGTDPYHGGGGRALDVAASGVNGASITAALTPRVVYPDLSQMAAAAAGTQSGAGSAGSNGGGGGTDGNNPGAGGNGGGAAGMVVLIAPTITYSGTVTGRLVQITGTDALDFIRGYYVD